MNHVVKTHFEIKLRCLIQCLAIEQNQTLIVQLCIVIEYNQTHKKIENAQNTIERFLIKRLAIKHNQKFDHQMVSNPTQPNHNEHSITELLFVG